ncbi:transcription factor RcaD [Microcoleus sp. FACHB-53]|nr:transcription factor RcaD [Microcoleus sp. FACHB-53]
MDTIELKFLLKLLGFPDYRAPLSKITPNSKTSATERERICRKLLTRDLVECSYEVTKLKIAPPGKALLKSDSTELPVTDQELKVLRASEKEKISPGKTGVPAAERGAIIQRLADRGLIELETKVKEVWLSKHGQEYLRDEYTAKGTNLVLNLDMLNNYLSFLRKSLQVKPDRVSPPLPTNGELLVEPTDNLSDEEILQIIQKLDQELGTDNYLPIFHLRQKLQPGLSREDLDQTLYRLQKNDQIELRALVHAQEYTDEQVNAGINQRSGCSLFFIKVTAN